MKRGRKKFLPFKRAGGGGGAIPLDLSSRKSQEKGLPNGLLTNNMEGGGTTKREWGGGGHVKFYPYEKGKYFSLLRREHTQFWGSFYGSRT